MDTTANVTNSSSYEVSLHEPEPHYVPVASVGLHNNGNDPTSFDVDSIVPASQLSTKYLEQLQQQLEHDIYAAREAERQAAELKLQEARCAEDVARRLKEDAENAYILQERFRYALPNGREHDTNPPSTVHGGMRERPACPSVPSSRELPPLPADDATTPEKDLAYAERLAKLGQITTALQTARHAAEFDVEESLFALQSSDDSDGYDEDYDAEWRDETSNIFARCRAVECTPLDDEGFVELGKLADQLVASDVALTNSERSMLWNALRMTYRLAEPVHVKHWLTSVSQLADNGNFAARPAIANFTYLLAKMKPLRCWTARQRTKIERWTYRCSFLVRKRVVALQEYGHREPTWKQVHVSIGGLDREVKVPQYTLPDTLEALTEHSTESCALSTDRAAMRAYLGK